jgi:hypothetical protein
VDSAPSNMSLKQESDFPYIRDAFRHDRHSMFVPGFAGTFDDYKLINYFLK